MNESALLWVLLRRSRYYIHVKTEFLDHPWVNSNLMQFRSLEPQEFILLAIEFSLKSVRRFLAMPCHYYSHVKTEFLVCPWVNFNAVQVIRTTSIHSTDH